MAIVRLYLNIPNFLLSLAFRKFILFGGEGGLNVRREILFGYAGCWGWDGGGGIADLRICGCLAWDGRCWNKVSMTDLLSIKGVFSKHTFLNRSLRIYFGICRIRQWKVLMYPHSQSSIALWFSQQFTPPPIPIPSALTICFAALHDCSFRHARYPCWPWAHS